MSEMLEMLFSHSQHNLIGGHDFYSNDGSLVGHSQENIMGGHDLYDDNGSLIEHTQPNLLGGVNMMNEDGSTLGHTSEGITGTNVYDSDGHLQGTGHDTMTGGEYTNVQNEQMVWRDNLMGGVSTDPLSQVNAITFPPLL